MKEEQHSSLFSHEHPKWLLKYTSLLKALFLINYLIQLRKWYLSKVLKSFIREIPPDGKFLDVGCGEGQFLLPYANLNRNCRFVGVDKNQWNVLLCENYVQKSNLKNVDLHNISIEELNFQNEFNVVICIGVLHYVSEDQVAIDNIYNALTKGGKVLLYSPINNKIYTSFYNSILKSFTNYETVQDRKRIYIEAELLEKLGKANFKINGKMFTYSVFGALSDELIHSCFILLAHANILIKVIIVLVLLLIYPIILLFMIFDYLLPKKNGNGVLIIAQK